MTVAILDFCEGKVYLEKVPAHIDAEEFVEQQYGLDNVNYMTVEDDNLQIWDYREPACPERLI